MRDVSQVWAAADVESRRRSWWRGKMTGRRTWTWKRPHLLAAAALFSTASARKTTAAPAPAATAAAAEKMASQIERNVR